jgi:hypothetical protein
MGSLFLLALFPTGRRFQLQTDKRKNQLGRLIGRIGQSG